MIDTSRAGYRFVVRPGVRTFAGNFHGQKGTIICEYDNGVGKPIIKCHIDQHGEAVLLATDIEIETQNNGHTGTDAPTR